MRYGDKTGQNKAKKSVPGALEAKPEVEIWRRRVFPTQRPWLPIWLRILYGVYLAPLRLHRERILTLGYRIGSGTWNIFAFRTPKSDFSRFFPKFQQNLFELRNSESIVGCRSIDQVKNSKICQLNFEKKWVKVHTGQTPYLPRMGAIPPKNHFY